MDEENSLLKLIQNASQEPTALDKKDDTKGDNSDFEDNENNEPQAISLNVRQPSFSSLSGVLIPKGKDAPLDLTALEETEGDNVVVLTKPESSKLFQSNAQEVVTEHVEEEDDEKDEPMTLKFRQPSYSSLNSHDPILKGDVHVGTELPALDEEGSEAPIVQQLAAANAKRWELMGYDPKPMQRNCSYQTFTEVELKKPSLADNKTKSVSCLPDLKDTFHLSQTGPLFTSSAFLKLEMPSDKVDENDEMEDVNEAEYADSNVSSSINSPLYGQTRNKDYGLHNSGRDESANESTSTNNSMRSRSSSGTASNLSSKRDKKAQTYPYPQKRASKTSSPSKNSKKFEAIDGLPDEFGLDLTELKKEQAYDSEQGSSRIPERIKQIVEDENIEKTSIVYLALCQQSIVGYKRKFKQAIKRLEELLNKTTDLGYITESEYIADIIQKCNQEKNQLKNTLNASSNETQDQLETAKKDREALIREFDVKKMSIDNERDSAIEEIMNNYNTDIELIDDTWSSEKKRQEYSRPSPTLMNKRKQAITLLKAKKFKESAVINEEAKQLEEQEIQAAYNKLEADYQKCIKKRDDKKAADIRAVQQLHEKRMNDFQRQKTLALKKFDNRIATLEEKIKSKASSQAKTKTTNKKTPNTTSRSISNSGNASPRKTCDIVLQNEPLKLPQLKINHSRPQTSLCQSRNGKRTSFSKTTPF